MTSVPSPASCAAGVLADRLAVEQLRRGVLLVLRHRVRDPALAEDLCSEAFRIVLERLQREPLEDPAKLAAFVAQTARNLAIAEFRKDSRRRTVTGEDEAIAARPDPARDTTAGIQDDHRIAAIRTTLSGMRSARDRELLVRYYLRDEDKETICRSLGLSEAHFNRVIFRARERFRAVLETRYRRTDLLGLCL